MFGGIKNPYLQSVIEMTNWLNMITHIFKYGLWTIWNSINKIVENGLDANDVCSEDAKFHDIYHIDYLRDHIQAMREVIEDGVTWWDTQCRVVWI